MSSPSPTGNTSTNFSLTLRAVADALRALGDASLPQTTSTMARAAVLGARGNSGMMLAHFLIGVAESLGQKATATPQELAAALTAGSDKLYDALDDPREGTILTVAREAAAAARRAAASSPDLAEFMRRMHAEGEEALARTPELMAALKEAGVVDAGGMGFMRMIEGVVRFIDGDPILAAGPAQTGEFSVPAADVAVEADQDYQYCTEVVVRGEQLPAANEVRAALRGFGGSLVVAVMGDVLHAHVHTNTPDAVFTYVSRWGALEKTKAEDMRAQHRGLQHGVQKAVAMVADSASDLPDAVLDRHGITLVPLQVIFGDEVLLDRVQLRPEEFYRRMRTATVLPSTSQPTVADFVRVFREARHEADQVIAVLVSSGLSGTFQAGAAALKAGGLTNVRLVDSKSASLGSGMLALRGAELAEQGWPAEAIASELERVRDQSGVFLTVDKFDNLLRSGRVSRGKAWIGGLLDVKPILSLDGAGRVVPVDRARGREALIAKVLARLDARLHPRPQQVRFGVVHAEAPEVAERVRTALVAAYQPRDCFVSLATGVLGTHVGEGAWAVFYQVEDGTPPRPAGGTG